MEFNYLKATFICRPIFLQFWLKLCFAKTKFCDLYVEMVQGRQILMFVASIVQIANVSGYKVCVFEPICRNVPKVYFFRSFSVFYDINILASTPPTDVKFAPKYLFSGVLQYDIEFYLKGVQKNLEIKIYPPPLVLKGCSLERSH